MTTRKPSAITWKKRKREGKRKNTRVPALDEISINVAQSRARHPAINPTLLSQFLATSPPSFHLYERLGKGEGERKKSIETPFFPAAGKSKTWRRNRDNRRKPTRSLVPSRKGWRGDGWTNSWWWSARVEPSVVSHQRDVLSRAWICTVTGGDGSPQWGHIG